MSLQHKCEISLLQVCKLSQGYGSGYVSCSIVVLTSRIHQKESLLLEQGTAGFIWRIMHHGPIGAVGCYCPKAWLKEALLLHPELQKPFRSLHLSNFPLVHFLVKPVEKACQGCTILEISLLLVFYLHRILYSLHDSCHIVCINYPAVLWNCMEEACIYPVLLEDNG